MSGAVASITRTLLSVATLPPSPIETVRLYPASPSGAHSSVRLRLFVPPGLSDADVGSTRTIDSVGAPTDLVASALVFCCWADVK